MAAHILICFLALALSRALELWMQGKGLGTCVRQLFGEIATIRSLDVVVPVRTAAGVTALRLRSVAKPEPLVAQLLQHLGLELPAGIRLVESKKRSRNVVAKTALGIA